MSILVNKQTRLLIQGITGLQASFHTKRIIEGGTNVVAGVSPQATTQSHLGVPIFRSVKEAVEKTRANASLLCVPARHVKEAVKEAKEVLKDESADQEKIEAAAKELNDKIMPIGAKMYEAASKDEAKDEKKSDDKKSDDDAVEGEVVDK